MKSVLELERLRKTFGGLVAVNTLSFAVEEGEILGFIGPNGAGKTTVFNLIMGSFKPDSGRIIFKGRDITGWRTYRVVNCGIARVFQLSRFLRHKTVFENIEISTIQNRIFARENRQARERKILQAAELVGLGEDLWKLPGALPHASLRRLEIAKAIATDPELLLLDEPFAGLSAAEVEEVSGVIGKFRESGRTVVLVDHNMRGVMRLVDRVVVICFGEKLAEGTPAEVAANPQVQEAYLAGGGVNDA
ncbi:MAG: ABC transporter ATP-binding protein [Candidatus Acetothermia bacterium]|nr:ABC transporter ATP-binding protein [Candidatus Acetothermia bacterium]MDH7504713.1 ABC transporter ATP-binding protein [Candidatus Acetothermia bacterium]